MDITNRSLCTCGHTFDGHEQLSPNRPATSKASTAPKLTGRCLACGPLIDRARDATFNEMTTRKGRCPCEEFEPMTADDRIEEENAERERRRLVKRSRRFA
jgi:hypothetical protein